MRTGCLWRGTFVSDDGRVLRADVGISNGDRVRAGRRVPALDVGDQVVYPKNDLGALTSNVFFGALVFVVSLVTLFIWAFLMLNRVRRRRRGTPAGDWRSGSSPTKRNSRVAPHEPDVQL